MQTEIQIAVMAVMMVFVKVAMTLGHILAGANLDVLPPPEVSVMLTKMMKLLLNGTWADKTTLKVHLRTAFVRHRMAVQTRLGAAGHIHHHSSSGGSQHLVVELVLSAADRLYCEISCWPQLSSEGFVSLFFSSSSISALHAPLAATAMAVGSFVVSPFLSEQLLAVPDGEERYCDLVHEQPHVTVLLYPK